MRRCYETYPQGTPVMTCDTIKILGFTVDTPPLLGLIKKEQTIPKSPTDYERYAIFVSCPM